jgi:superfamily II DNA or RNA helicase
MDMKMEFNLEFTKPLRPYQETMHDLTMQAILDPFVRRLQVYSPTGSGKTINFIYLIYVLQKLYKRKLNICITHPRIALSQDQLTRLKEELGTFFHYTSFHSGEHVKGSEEILEKNTTDPEELSSIIDNCEKSHITLSSYKSFHKIASMNFDLLICDEAHNLVHKEHYETLRNIGAAKMVSYTATPVSIILKDEERGMSDGNLFGEVVAQIAPKDLFSKGYIVPPMIHRNIITSDGNGEMNVLDIVANAFIFQREEMKKSGMKHIKLLVCSRGLADHRQLEEQLEELYERIGERVPIFAIEGGESRVDGVRKNNRNITINELKSCNESAIVIHYDTINEGIDISGLTGVVFLRNIAQWKLIQAIGRCARPYYRDIDRYGNVIDIETRMKPHCIISLPFIDGTPLGNWKAEDIAAAFIAGGYGDLTDYQIIDKETKHADSSKTDIDEWSEKPTNDDWLAKAIDVELQYDMENLMKLKGIEF